MDTKITKSNAKSAIKDDKAHIDYIKRDVLDDQKYGGKNKDINQTADEKHISKLAGDIRHDHTFLSKHMKHIK